MGTHFSYGHDLMAVRLDWALETMLRPEPKNGCEYRNMCNADPGIIFDSHEKIS